MGQLIYLEQLKIEREQKIRSLAYKHFPWEEMDLIQLYILQPLSEEWSKQKQILVSEATYRLVFDAYLLGLKEKMRQSGSKKTPNDIMDQTMDLLIEQITTDFRIHRLFSPHHQESIQILFHSLAQEWFLRGLMCDQIY